MDKKTRIQAGCRVPGCTRTLCAKGLCRLHWERQHNTGTTDDPTPRTGVLNPMWRGADAGYKAVHLRMSTAKRPSSCEFCGTDDGRFEWALRPDVPPDRLKKSPEGWAYSVHPEDYANLCKPCHNVLDLGATECKDGHPLSGDNLYIQPSNGKRYCRACQARRTKERGVRNAARRKGGSS